MHFFSGHAKVRFSAAAVYQQGYADNLAASFVYHVYYFPNRAAGRHDVFHDKDFFTGSNGKAAAQRHDAFFPFGEDGSRPQSSAGDLGQNDAARSRSDNGFHAFVFEVFRDFIAEFFRVFRVLEYIEFFYVHRAVQAGSEQEMSFQNSFCID